MAVAATCALAACGLGETAAAAPARIRFHVEPKPYSEALIDVAQQANVTLIGAGACAGTSRTRLVGAMTLETALSRVLAGAPCSWRLIAPGAVEVSALARREAPRPLSPATVGEVLVTATKRVRSARELAVAVSAVPRDQLRATGASDAGEAAGQLAGVLATNLGPGRNKLLLRGLSDGAYTGRARSVVATYLDELPVNYNAPDPDLRLVDVERVEVARGPQGALYGAGSLSGVYRIVTRKPDLNGFSAEVRASGAATQGGDPSYAIEGFINAPVLRDDLGLRLSAYQEVQGGYLDDITQNRSNVDRTERRGARLILLFQPNDAWMVSLTAAGQHLRSDDTHYTTPGLGLTRSVRIQEPHVNDIELATATVKHSWGWAELTSATGFVRHAYGSLYDATATQHNYTDRAKTSAYSERTRAKMLVEDLYLTSRGAGPIEWLAGVYASDTSLHSPTEFLAQNPNLPNVPVYGDNRHDDVREVAAYAELSYEFTPGWTVAAGGRVFSIRSRTRSEVVSERFMPRSVDRVARFASFSPKLSIQHVFGDGDLAYAVASEGYRSGGTNSGGANPLPPSRATFAPDRLRNYEVGVKLQALDRRLSLNSALFYDVWKDIQTDQFRNSGIPYTTNAGDAHIVGLEAELGYRTDSGFAIQLNGRLSRTRTTNANPDFTSQLSESLPGAPAISGGAVLSYEREIFDDWTMRLIAQATYVGRSRVTFDAAPPEMGGYARTKLSAEFTHNALGLQIFVINPLNDFSDTFAYGNPFNPDQTRQITPQRPRTVGVTLSAAM
ncbi:MAG: TonB-dependent receptor plug domain-containing protein [Phenylobacterium sp.]|uniref:TonB-dependent receptor n=1 Tax=Phenylobacterium sp. TaxID=1871053 RepID=UPI0025F3DB73|nr:TonB-dependent receptor [Phenylobacterium sp.]MBI1197790.1 TonB-dependent receptor plug domain-containing protein [Phenylobacterium sp.]